MTKEELTQWAAKNFVGQRIHTFHIANGVVTLTTREGISLVIKSDLEVVFDASALRHGRNNGKKHPTV